MAKVDSAEVSRLMTQRVRERQAFRQEHGPSLPGLMQAEDDYRNSGREDDYRAAVETACRERPELEVQLRRLFGLPNHDGAAEDFEG